MGFRLRYVKSDDLKADGTDLRSIPITVKGESRLLGELDGIVIDVKKRRVCHLVVETRNGERLAVPLDDTRLNRDGVLVTSAADVEAAKKFEPSAYGEYDEDAVMSLLFGSPAAA